MRKLRKRVGNLAALIPSRPKYDAECCAKTGLGLETWAALGQEDRNTLLWWAEQPDNRKDYDRASAVAVNLPVVAWLTLPPEGKAASLALARQRQAIARRCAEPSKPAKRPKVERSPEAASLASKESKSQWARRSREENPEVSRAAKRRYRQTHKESILEAQRVSRAAKRAAKNAA